MDSSITPAYKNVEIITIGDEIINGQIVDSNSAWIASFLNRSGFEVDKITSVPDDAQAIFRAVDSALGSSPIVLLTGGLGPTKDDITKHCLCSYFKTKLVFNQAVYDNMTGLFNKRGLRRINDFNRSQAEVPEACTVIVNRKGTAPVTWFEREGKILVSMPGVPLEMMWCMEKEIMPRLLNKVQSHPILQRYIWVKGYPEAVLAEFISDWEDALPPELKLAYLPQRSVMLLRLTAKNNDETTLIGLLETQLAGLRSRLGSAIFAEGVKTLEEALGQVLIKKRT
jgi:nicotinamide-nucleotide amidase